VILTLAFLQQTSVTNALRHNYWVFFFSWCCRETGMLFYFWQA